MRQSETLDRGSASPKAKRRVDVRLGARAVLGASKIASREMGAERPDDGVKVAEAAPGEGRPETKDARSAPRAIESAGCRPGCCCTTTTTDRRCDRSTDDPQTQEHTMRRRKKESKESNASTCYTYVLTDVYLI